MSIITPESKIEELRLSAQATNCLREAGILFVGDLLEKAGAELRVHCDERAFSELREVLARAGLHVGEDLD